jgi:CBS domain containing-hemolysin-like protein
VNDVLIIMLTTIAMIALSAFFVIIEFALLGARRQRLEPLAATSLSARAALRGMNDLTLMLAGAQLGITVCTFVLGAVSKPAVDSWLSPMFTAMGLPEWAASGAAFALALFVVTFLHLVAGEMAPKSWAIAHPEKSALSIGVISRAYIWPLRPFLNWVNSIANRLVRAAGVEPVESAAVGGQDIATIRQLVEHSANVGALEPQMQQQISGLIDLGTLSVEALVEKDVKSAHVTPQATVADIRAAAFEFKHMRILMHGVDGTPPSVVHVRDTLLMAETQLAIECARPAFILGAQTPVYEALARMREASAHLAVLMEGDEVRGIITLADILRRVMPAGVPSQRVFSKAQAA